MDSAQHHLSDHTSHHSTYHSVSDEADRGYTYTEYRFVRLFFDYQVFGLFWYRPFPTDNNPKLSAAGLRCSKSAGLGLYFKACD